MSSKSYPAYPAYPAYLAYLAYLVVSFGCASLPAQQAGAGDVAFRLSWIGTVDLDLEVTSPLAEVIDLDHKKAASGGELDRDCNATAESMCAEPVENVFWARGTAPRGVYKYSVRMFNLHENTFPVMFRVEILKGRKVVSTRLDRISRYGETRGSWEFVLK